VIQRWNAMLPPTLQPRVRVTALADRAGSGKLPPQLTLPLVLDPDESAIGALALAPGGLVVLDDRGTIAWTQSTVSAGGTEDLANLGAIIADVLAGVDVPGRVRDQWKQAQQAYTEQLRANSVSHK
jgi:hypothetical protein